MADGTSGADTFTAPAGASTFNGLSGVDTLILNFALVDATFTWTGNQLTIHTASSDTVVTGFEVFQFTDGTVHNDDGSPLIDDLFYYAHSHDVWNAHLDADAHYNAVGWHEKRDPNAFFSTSIYLTINPDVAAAGINPLTHFHQVGWTEGRDPGLDFDVQKYLQANPDVAAANIDPLFHFLSLGAEEGRQPFPAAPLPAANGFDYVYYIQNNPDVVAAGVDPFQHFQTVGWTEGRNPNAYFDTRGYLATNPDVAAAGINPLDHFHSVGWSEGRNPSPYFDVALYLQNNPDVAAAHVDPLQHFLQFGIQEGRVAYDSPLFDEDGTVNAILEGAANGTQVGLNASWGGWLSPGLTFSITGDTSGGGFTINTATGVITVANGTLIDFENAPGPGNTYSVTVQAADNGNTQSQTFIIAVADAAPAPPTGADPIGSVNELAANGTLVGINLTVTDPNGPAPTYTLTNDAGGRFTIDSNGDIRVANGAAVDFETAPGHAYTVIAKGTVGAGSVEKTYTINVNDVNDNAPVFTSSATPSVGEFTTFVVALTTTDADTVGTNPPTFTITGGADMALFSLVGNQLQFIDAKDFETQAHSYAVQVTANDGTNTTVQNITVTLTDDNDNEPVFTSSATPSVVETTTAVVALTTTDADTVGTNPPIFTITGGADAALFQIVGNQLQFITARDFETQAHSYAVQVTANDGVNTEVQNLTVTLTDANDTAPAFTSSATPSVAENTTAVVNLTTTDPDTVGTNPPTFTITGGADQGLFTIVGNQLQLNAARDFETQAHSYAVEVTANDGTNSTIQSLTVTLTDLNDTAPAFTSSATPSVAENTTAVVSLTTTDPDTLGTNPPTFTITGGADMALFQIVGNQLQFITARDFETQAHSYAVEVTANDGTNSTIQTLTVTLADQNDNAPVFTSAATPAVNENANVVVDLTATDADTVGTNPPTFTITGGADMALFQIVGSQLQFIVAPDYETQAHIYAVEVTANDGTNSTVQSISVALADVNDNAPIFSSGTSASVDEGISAATTVYDADATDADGTPANSTITYSLSAGGDNDLFDINASTGVVMFKVTPNFEAPTDAGGNSVYDIVVHAVNGGDDVTRSVAITVGNLAPAFAATPDSDPDANEVSNGAGAGALAQVDADASDPAGGTVTYALIDSGGAPANGGDRFTIDPSTGVITVSGVTPIVFDNSVPANNVFVVTVRASDPSGAATFANFTITITPNAAPSITAGDTLNYVENGPATVIDPTITITDADVGDNIEGATVRITTGFASGQDELTFTPVGAISGNFVGDTLTLTGTGTALEYEQVLESVRYRNTSDDPSGATRTIEYVVNDGAANSNIATATVTVAPRNDEPTLSAIGTSPTYTENGAAVDLYNTVAASTIEVGQNLDQLVFTVSGVGTGSGQFMTVDGSGFLLTNGSTLTTLNNGMSVSVSNPAGTATVTVSKVGGISASAMQTLIDGLAFTAQGNDPAAGSRVVTITSLRDTGLDGGGNDNLNATLNLQSSVTVVAVNDEPTLSATGTNPGFTENGAAVDLFSVPSASTIEASQTLNNLMITVTNVAGTGATENLTIDGTVVELTDLNSEVTLTNGMTAAVSLSGGTATVTISKAGGVSATVIQAIIDGLAYGNTSDNPGAAARTVTITSLMDNGGTAAGGDDTVNPAGLASAVTVTPVNDAPVVDLVTGGGVDNTAVTQTFNEGAGPPSTAVFIVPNLDLIDVDSADLTGATVTLNSMLAQDVLTVNGSTSGSLGGVTFNVVANVVTFSGTATVDAYEAAIEAVQYNNTSEAPAPGTRTFDISVTDGSDPSTTATATVNVVGQNDAPVNSGVPASLTVHSNTPVTLTGLSIGDVDAGSASNITTTLVAPEGTFKIGTGSSGDNAGIGGGAIVTTNGTGTITLTGTVAQINTSLGGSNVVFTAKDDTGTGFDSTTTITMTTNDAGNSPSGALTDVDVINVGVLPQVWFINQDQSGADPLAPRGSQDNPFATVDEFNAAAVTPTGPGPNDYIYVKAGTYSGQGINLENGQTLLGDDQPLSFDNPYDIAGPDIVIETSAGARPTISVAAANSTDQGIDLASGNTIKGVNIVTNAAGQSGIDDGNNGAGAADDAVGTLNISNVQVTGIGKAIDVDEGGTLNNVTLEKLTSTGSSSEGIDLGGGLTGSLTVNDATSTISNAGGAGFEMTGGGSLAVTFNGSITGTGGVAVNVDGGTGSLDFNGAISKTTNGQTINMTNKTGGTVSFDGTVSSTGASDGINLDNNDNATISFTQTLTINTSASNTAGFTAINGGTVTATGGSNTINSGSGTALSVTGTTIGANDLTFQSISANGAANGIVLSNTGAGDLRVTGTGTAGSGGTIQNTSGAGISLTNTGPVILDRMIIQNSATDGISGTTVGGFRLDNSSVLNNGNAVGENGVELFNVTGTSSFLNTTISGGGESNLLIQNTVATLLNLTVSGSTFSNNNATTGNDGFLLEANGSANIVASITGSTFNNNKGDHFQFSTTADATSTTNLTFTGNTLTSPAATTPAGTNVVGGNITISPSGGADLTFNVSNNNIQYAVDSPININVGTASTAASQVQGKITNNIIGTAGNVGSGGIADNGLTVTSNGLATTTILVDSNTIREWRADFGMYIVQKEGDGTLNATVTNNNIANPSAGGFPLNGLRIQSGATASDNGILNLELANNTIPGNAVYAATVRILPRFDTDWFMPGYGGALQDDAAVASYFAGKNPGITASNGLTYSVNLPNAGHGYHNTAGGAAVPLPANPTLPPALLVAVAGGVASATGAAGDHDLTMAELSGIVSATLSRWAGVGLTGAQLAALDGLQFEIADLGGSHLGLSSPGLVVIDDDASGYGWFIDSTPFDDAEFGHALSATQLQTDASGAPAGQMDLLTVVMHEIGHALGFDHSDDHPGDLMSDTLVTGERRLPDAADAAATNGTLRAPEIIGPTIVNGFDAAYYLAHNPDVAAAGVDPLFHFNVVGWTEGRDPNAFFDTEGYLAHYADVAAAGMNPLQHYAQFGWHEGRDPSTAFDTLAYLAANPDVAAANVNPLDHFLQSGFEEGRAALTDGLWR